jgi:DNA polymerase elongation subunit (family B)
LLVDKEKKINEKKKMTEFYNKVLKYSDALSSADKTELLKQIPTRKFFVSKNPSHEKVTENIRNNEELLFMPNDHIERNEKRDGPLKYELLLFGILRDGSKAGVILTNIKVFFDVLIPSGADSEDFLGKIKSVLTDGEKKIYMSGSEIVQLKPFKGFCLKPLKFMRLYFNTSFYRAQAINELKKREYSTYEDDLRAHYNKVFREYKIASCGWNFIKNYEKFEGADIVDEKFQNVSYVFKLDVSNIKAAVFEPSRENEDLLKDKSIVVGWDIETYAPHPTGNAPLPENVYSATKDGTFEDKIIDLSLTFTWRHLNKPFFTINLTALPAPKRKDCMIIQCRNQIEISRLMSVVLKKISPELLTGFNDGLYDWPFVLQRAELHDRNIIKKKGCASYPAVKKYKPYTNYAPVKRKTRFTKGGGGSFNKDENPDREEWVKTLKDLERNEDLSKMQLLTRCMKTYLSCLTPTKENLNYAIQLENIEEIKLEAGNQKTIYNIRVPGMICFDTRVIFQQLYPTSDKSSLNHYLSINNLGSKEDMAPGTMFKIYRVIEAFKERKLLPEEKLDDFDEYIKYINKVISDEGPDFIMFETLIGSGDYNISKLTARDVLHLLGGEEYGGKKSEGISQLIHYCNIDSCRCQELLNKKNVVVDKREMGNKTYTSMYDNFYRAGGMKVRNKAMSIGCNPEWGLAFSCNSNIHQKDERKYPGAYVLSPVKGLYRDHKFIKFKRCQLTGEDDQETGSQEPTIAYEEVTPCEKNFNKELCSLFKKALKDNVTPRNFQLEEVEIRKKISMDQNLKSDRPCTGLDFSSLYPSLIITYNISPEKAVTSKQMRDILVSKGYTLLEINFRYAIPGEKDDPKDVQHGWFVQHTHPAGKIIRDEVERAKRVFADSGAKTKYGWTKLVNQSIIKEARTQLMNTSLEKWQEYGMGLYPYILKQLFDERKLIKKQMEKYEKSKEFLDSLFLNTNTAQKQEEQLKIMREYADKRIAELETEAHQKNEKYFADQADVIKSTMKFLTGAITSPEGEYKDWKLEDIREEVLFSFSYYNSKQLSLKVFMNTFYGETGNSLSPFFIVLVAGAITVLGQQNLKMVISYAQEEGFSVHYGDTDSAYTSAAERYFVDLDKLYESGEITKLEYWTRMVKITMTALDQLKSQVNDLLMMNNGTLFLNMAYEEVLWPFALLGKKKYLGIPHMGLVNSKPWLKDCPQKDFNKALFIRGLEVKKRMSSEVLKVVCFELFKEMFCIESTTTLRGAVENKLGTLSKRVFDTTLFVKSAKYKLPDPGKPGNKSVLSFVDRMTRLKTKHPDLVRDIEIGERFPFVVVRRYPWKYDLRGCKVDVKVGDKYEYPEMISDPEKRHKYEQILGEKLEIDIDHYITNEIVGQFARLIVYHPNYDKFWKENMTDEEYKKADEEAWAYAKKILGNYYEEKFAKKYISKGAVHKKVFHVANDTVMAKIGDIYGEAAGLFELVNSDITGNTNNDGEVQKLSDGEAYDLLIAKVEKISKKSWKPLNMVEILKTLDIKPIEAEYSVVLRKNSYYKTAIEFEQTEKKKILLDIRELAPIFNDRCSKSVNKLLETVALIKKENQVDTLYSTYVTEEEYYKTPELDIEISTTAEMEGDDILDDVKSGSKEEDDKVLDLYDKFISLTACEIRLLELDNMKEGLKYATEVIYNKKVAIRDVLGDNRDDFVKFYQRRKETYNLHNY